MSYNKVMVIGNLGHNSGKKQAQTEWHRVVVAGKLAGNCNEYLKKGRHVFVEGRLRTRDWEINGANGRKQHCTEIITAFLGWPPVDAKTEKILATPPRSRVGSAL